MEDAAGVIETSAWSELLQQSRLALARLESDALEELAARAERMLLASTPGGAPIRQRIAQPERNRVREITRNRDLLRDLLHESSRNLKVLRESSGLARPSDHAGEAAHRWVR